jgi:hypothetical protein
MEAATARSTRRSSTSWLSIPATFGTLTMSSTAPYCTIYFRYPEEWAEDLKKIESSIPFDPDARWKAMLDAMKAKEPV